MEIAVCICLVPDTASPVVFVDGALERSAESLVINPYDEYALEEALRFRERLEGGTVTIFSIVPSGAHDQLRKALAMGADEVVAIALQGTLDPYRTAAALAEAINTHYSSSTPDLVLCGRHSVDFQEGAVPLMLAELLGLPALSAVNAVELVEGSLHLQREIEGGTEAFELPLPALLSAEKGLNVPRKTSIKGVMAARRKPMAACSLELAEAPRVALGQISKVERGKSCRMLATPGELARLLVQETTIR